MNALCAISSCEAVLTVREYVEGNVLFRGEKVRYVCVNSFFFYFGYLSNMIEAIKAIMLHLDCHTTRACAAEV